MAKIKWFATINLKKERERRNLTQQQMADLISLEFGRPVSVSLYQKWENQEQSLSPEQVLDLSRLFRMRYDELVAQK